MAKEALNASWESGRDSGIRQGLGLGIRQGFGNQAGIWESGRDSHVGNQAGILVPCMRRSREGTRELEKGMEWAARGWCERKGINQE